MHRPCQEPAGPFIDWLRDQLNAFPPNHLGGDIDDTRGNSVILTLSEADLDEDLNVLVQFLFCRLQVEAQMSFNSINCGV